MLKVEETGIPQELRLDTYKFIKIYPEELVEVFSKSSHIKITCLYLINSVDAMSQESSFSYQTPETDDQKRSWCLIS